MKSEENNRIKKQHDKDFNNAVKMREAESLQQPFWFTKKQNLITGRTVQINYCAN